MFNHQQYLDVILNPVLQALGLDNDSWRMLLTGTMAHESKGGTYLKQIVGPAMGIMQMEELTHNSIWQAYLPHQPILTSRLMTLCQFSRAPGFAALGYHLLYATAMAAILYKWRIEQHKSALPKTLAEAASVWKLYYNCNGKGTVEEFISNYEQFTNTNTRTAKGTAKAKN